MNRRQYLATLGSSVSLSVPPVVEQELITANLPSVTITETNAPVQGGDLLEVTASVESDEDTLRNLDVELFVEENESASKTVTVDPQTTENVDFQHRVYPVRADVEFDIRVSVERTSAQQQIEVRAADELSEEDVNPDVDVMVQPETAVIFEIDDTIPDEYGNTHWFLDGEYEHQSSEPLYSSDEPPDGYEYWLNTFSDEGTFDIAAAVDNEDQNYTYQWAISVDSNGVAPPTVEEARPETIGADSSEDHDIELDIASSDDELDRVVWWDEGSSEINDASDVNGSEDKASTVTQGGSAPTVWVITENNVVTEASPWEVEEAPPDDEEEDLTPEDRDLSDLQIEWVDLIEQTHGLEVLDIAGTDGDDSWMLYYRTTGTIDIEDYELGAVADSYAWLVDEHPNEAPDTLFVYAIDDPDADPLSDGAVGGFYIEREWAEEWLLGLLTDDEYALLVARTYGDDPS